MKHHLHVLTFLVFLALAACTQMRTPSSVSSPPAMQQNLLTVERAQQTLNIMTPPQPLGRIQVRGGVHEIPAQNIATIDFDCIEPPGHWSGGRGTATFSRFNDGRWFLTNVKASLSNPDVTHFFDWNFNIEVQ